MQNCAIKQYVLLILVVLRDVRSQQYEGDGSDNTKLAAAVRVAAPVVAAVGEIAARATAKVIKIAIARVRRTHERGRARA
jgi:hypothetical protein